MNEEIWKDAVGYEGLYSVSSLGRVRRDAHGGAAVPGRILKPATQQSGHLSVNLCRDGLARNRYVHRLVALAFLGAPKSDRPEVAHGDGNPKNNVAENLRWANRTENVADTLLHGTRNRGERHGGAKLTEHDVRLIREAYAAGGVSQQDLATQFAVNQANISRAIHFKRWAWLKAA